MAITVTKQIPPVVLAGNPCKVEVNTDRLYTTAGAKTQKIYQLGTFEAGDQLVLEWTDKDGVSHEVEYNCTNNPRAPLDNVFVEAAFPWERFFLGNFELSRTFDYKHETGYEKFTAKEALTGITISLTGDNYLDIDSTVGVTPVKRSDLTVELEVYEWSNETGLRYLSTESIKPDINGDVVFNIAEYLENLFDTDVLPNTENGLLVMSPDLVKMYKFRMANKYSGVTHGWIDGNIYASAILPYNFTVLPGAISEAQYYQNEENGTNFYDRLQGEKLFISNMPRTKIIDTIQKEFLYYYFYDEDITSIKLIVKVYFTDGTNVSKPNTEAISIDAGNLAQYSLLQLMTGYTDLKIAYDESQQQKTADYYEVSLADQDDNVITEVVQYKIDRKYYINRREFLFRNNYGVYETVLFTGKGEFSNKYNREFFEKLTKIVQKKPQIETEYVVSTGYLNRETKEWMQAIASSTEVYERFFTDKGETYYSKIQILTDEIKPVLVDQVYVETFVMTYRLDTNENVYSKFKYPLWILDDGAWNDRAYWLDYRVWKDWDSNS
jgi:hypothetical protein